MSLNNIFYFIRSTRVHQMVVKLLGKGNTGRKETRVVVICHEMKPFQSFPTQHLEPK